MFSIVRGQIIQIVTEDPELQEIKVQLTPGGAPELAYNFPGLHRRVVIGEEVSLNTAAVKLNLGTGGRHFVIPDGSGIVPEPKGHIMKLRYTPWQFPVLTAEEEQSPYHDLLKKIKSLQHTPVVIAPLHSMLPGIVLGFRNQFKAKAKIVFIMTDGAALPIALSNLVRDLKTKGLLDTTITVGHAFGGDLEAVSLPSALLIARQVAQADLIVVSLGPGIVGTGTALGFSGIEQSWVIDLAAKLQGVPIAVPRLSSADTRERHFGISNHSLTILDLANQAALVPISQKISADFLELIRTKLKATDLSQRHHWVLVDDPPAQELFNAAAIRVKTMGRGLSEEPWFFQSSVSAGVLAALLYSREIDSFNKFME